jgi:CCR4-NOT transcription complex subunit 1
MHTRLLAMYLSSSPNDVTSSQLVFHQMLQINPEGLLSVLLEFYGEDENHLGRIMEIALEVQVSSPAVSADERYSTSSSIVTICTWPSTLPL